eukprot:gene3939-2802_t
METKQKKNADTYLVRRTWGALISQAVVTSLRCPSHKGSHNLPRCCSHALLLSPALTMRALLLLRGGAVAGRVAGHRSHRYRPQRVAQFRQSRSGTRRCRHGGCTAWWTGIGIRRTALWSSRRDATTRSLRRTRRLRGRWGRLYSLLRRLTAAHQATGFHDSFGRRSKDAGGRRRYKENACTTREEDKKNGKKRYRKTKITLCGMEILSDRLTYVRRFALLPLLEPLLYFVRSFMRACLCVTLQQSSGEGLSWGSSSLPILLPSRIRASTPRLVASMVLIVVGPSFGSQLAGMYGLKKK